MNLQLFLKPRCLLLWLFVAYTLKARDSAYVADATTTVSQDVIAMSARLARTTGLQLASWESTIQPRRTEQTDESRSESDSELYDIAEKLFLVLCPVVTVIGLTGNSLIFVIMHTSSLKRSPVSVFMAALAVADSLVLLLDLLNNWISIVFDYSILDEAEWFCKTHRFLFDVCYTYAAWLVAAVSVERCIAVTFPFQAKRFCTVKKSQVVVSILPIVISLIYLHSLWGWVKRDGRCDIHDDWQHYQREYGPWVNAVIYSWFPIATLIISNAVIVHQLSRVKKNQESMGVDKLETVKITTTVVLVCLTFTLLTLPLTLFYIILFAREMFNDPSPGMALGETFIILMGLTNHSINFFLYCLGLKKFRREVRRLLHCPRDHETQERSTSGLTLKSSVGVGGAAGDASEPSVATTTPMSMATRERKGE